MASTTSSKTASSGSELSPKHHEKCYSETDSDGLNEMGEHPNFHGLSICCYAPMLPHDDHFTCSDCSTLFNKVTINLTINGILLERGNDLERRV